MDSERTNIDDEEIYVNWENRNITKLGNHLNEFGKFVRQQEDDDRFLTDIHEAYKIDFESIISNFRKRFFQQLYMLPRVLTSDLSSCSCK